MTPQLAWPVDIGVEVLEPRVSHQRDDLRAGAKALRDPQRCDDVCARRRAREQRFLTGEASGHLLRDFGWHWHDLVHEARLPEWGRVTDAHAFDLVRPRRSSREHWRLARLDDDDADVRLVLLEHRRDAA